MYFVALTVVCVAALICLLGIFIKLPIFLNRRLVALGVLCVVALISPAIKGLRTEKQVAVEAEMDRGEQEAKAQGTAKDNLTIDAEVNRALAEIGGTITNSSDVDYKNIKAKCVFSGESGKKINTLKVEILKVAKAKSETKFSGVSAGYIDPQAVRFTCNVTGAEQLYSATPAS